MSIEEFRNETENSFGKFRLFRATTKQTFICPICKALGKREKKYTKTAKLHGEWETPSGKTHPICNGCFGSAVSISADLAWGPDFRSALETIMRG